MNEEKLTKIWTWGDVVIDAGASIISLAVVMNLIFSYGDDDFSYPWLGIWVVLSVLSARSLIKSLDRLPTKAKENEET
jgi:hypothetical protein